MEQWEQRFWSYVQKASDDECWIWLGGHNTGGKYGIFYAPKNGKRVQHRAHRLAYELLIGPIPEGLVCCHTCDNPACVNPRHVFLGTRDDNQKDMSEKGRAARGTRSASAKLSEQDVRDILKRISQGESRSRIANDYPVGRAMIGAIASRKAWLHVPLDSDYSTPTIINRGEDNGYSVLTSDKVTEIRKKQREGRTIASLAREYGTGESAIRSVVQRRTWNHIP